MSNSEKNAQRFHKDAHHFHIDRGAKDKQTLKADHSPEGVEVSIAEADHKKALFRLNSEEAASLGHWLIAQSEAAKQITKDGV